MVDVSNNCRVFVLIIIIAWHVYYYFFLDGFGRGAASQLDFSN